VSAVISVLFITQSAEFFFQESDLFLLSRHQSFTEIINLGTKSGVLMIRLFIITILSPSSLDISHLSLTEFVNSFAVLIVLMTEDLSLFSHLEGKLRELHLKLLASLREFRLLCGESTALRGIVLTCSLIRILLTESLVGCS